MRKSTLMNCRVEEKKKMENGVRHEGEEREKTERK